MKYVTHLIRWDLRRLRLPLSFWALLVAAYTLVVGLRPYTAADLSLRESVGVVDSLLWLTILLMTLATVSLVIHEHPTVGTDAFWMTRAIPPDSLLASKLAILVAATLVIPAAAESILLAINRMPLTVSLGVLAQTTAIRLVLLILLVAGAVMTRNLARFALVCGGAIMAVAAAIGIATSMLMGRLEDEPPIDTSARFVEDPSAGVVFNALFVLAVLVTLRIQYRTRLKRRSLAIGAAAVAGAVTISSLWSIPFLRHRLEVPEWASGLGVSVDTGRLSTNTQHAFYATRANEWRTVNGPIYVTGLPLGWSANVAVREASLELPNGTAVRSRRRWRTYALVGGGIHVGPESYVVLRDLLGVKVLGNVVPAQIEPPRPESLPVLFLFRRTEAAPLLPARGVYHARMDVNLTHFAVLGAIPLRPGATHQSGGYRLSIDRIGFFDRQLGVAAREARATSMWERRPWAQYRIFLRNVARAEAVAVSDYTMQHVFSLLRLLPVGEFFIGSAQSSGFSSRGVVLSVPPRYRPDATTVDVDDNWLRDAELVIVRQTEEGWVERTLDIPDFPIDQ
jgi:hypothetical protein